MASQKTLWTFSEKRLLKMSVFKEGLVIKMKPTKETVWPSKSLRIHMLLLSHWCGHSVESKSSTVSRWLFDYDVCKIMTLTAYYLFTLPSAQWSGLLLHCRYNTGYNNCMQAFWWHLLDSLISWWMEWNHDYSFAIF